MSTRRWALRLTTAVLLIGLAVGAFQSVGASDHDDGETNIKSRNLSLTDLYVFREDWHSGLQADAGNTIFVMCTNPRSLPRQQYFFNTDALYNFHVARAADINAAVTGVEDLRFEFQFGAPDNNSQQSIRLNVTTFANGAPQATTTVNGALTTPAIPGLGNPAPVINTLDVNGTDITVFSGLREDPFFFDVEAFFRVRAGLAGLGPAVGFNPPGMALDFAEGYNVNAIVMRVPNAFLGSDVIDVWETITLPANVAALQ